MSNAPSPSPGELSEPPEAHCPFHLGRWDPAIPVTPSAQGECATYLLRRAIDKLVRHLLQGQPPVSLIRQP